MAAQDAELKLKVSLDLAFFRQQLAGLGQAAAGYNMPINVRFDRRAVQNELNALGANIRRRNYSLEVKTNLDAEIKKAKDLADALRDLPKAQKAQGIAGVTGERFSQAALRKLGQDIKPLYKAAAEAGIVAFNEAIANNVAKIAKELSEVGQESITGLLNGLKSGDAQVKAAAESLGKALISSIKGILGIASPSRVFKAIGDDVGKGFELGATASMDRAFDELERKIQQRLGKLQDMLRMPASRRSAFPFVAMGGAPESGPIAREIDQAYAQLAQIRERRQGRLTFERESLAQAAGRLLPPARDRSLPAGRETILPGGGALDTVTQNFVRSLRDTRDTLARNFSANTYLPKATRALATSMNVATKQLSGTKIAGLLPSREMMEPLRFQRAQKRAAQIDAENIARQQAQQAAQQASLRGMFEGVPRINAPRVGQEETAIGRHIQNKVEQAIRNARQTLGLSIGPSSPYIPNPFAGAATVPPRQYFQAGGQAALPPAGGTGVWAELQRGTQEMLRRNERMTASTDRAMAALDRMIAARSGGGIGGSMGMFPMEGMMGPSSQLGRITAQTSMFAGGGGAVPPGGGGGRGGFGGFGGFGRAMGGVNLPGAGTIRELGSEFAFATKQVLLFGQAYKMLGFLQDFPGQVGQAVAQLQSFRNTLNTVATSAEDASESNQLILDLVDKYNVPLQSARDGFTKLYASMAPAGFSGDEIRDLFTGITQAAATFGMSADKVDRVNYAFAQMASKGQVMSEELKGQLGDVLPGAMAIFAEAAGFEGPKAIQDFSAALEDGVYKGEAMNVLLKNVGIVMKQEFGPGAEGAARTFQGVINRMQNSMQLLYESFEPVAVGFLNNVVMPLTDGIKQVSDGFTAFFTGAAARTTGGGLLVQELNSLRPAFEGIRQNVSELINQFSQFARVGLELGKVLLQIAGNPFVGYVLRVYANVLVLTTAVQLLNLRALVPMIANLARSAYALIAFTAQCVRAGQSLQVMGLMAKTAGTTLRAFFASTGVGLVLAGLGMLIERIMTLNQKMDETRQKAAAAGNAIRMMSGTEALAAERSYAGYAKSLEGLNKQLQEGQLKGKAWIAVNRQQAEALKAAGVIPSEVRGQAQVQPFRIGGAYQRLVQLQGEAAYRKRQLDFEEQQAQQSPVLAPIPEAAAEGAGKKTKGKELGEYDRSQLEFIQQRFEIEKQNLEKRLQGELISQTQYDISLAELKLETERLRIAEEYRLAVDKANKDNLSAADKALKLKDLEIVKNNQLAIAEEDRNIAIGAARQKIISPILAEIDNETLAIERQAAEANALKEGRLELTAAQEAELSVKERYVGLSKDEREMAKGELEVLRQIREQRIRNAEALRLQLSLQQKANEVSGIGGGFRAGFFGQAAGTFEQAMTDSRGDIEYATKMAALETRAMQLRSVFEGIQGAISGIGQAFGNVLTEGIASMISGTKTAKEVFADFLQSVGQALMQTASQMIATYIAIGIARMFAGFSGGSSGYSGGNVATNAFQSSDVLGLSNSIGGGSFFTGGAGAFANPTFGVGTFANGGVFTNSIVSSPAFFQFADGGAFNLGVMGEAGPEAVMPLTRGPDGRLGVEASVPFMRGMEGQQGANGEAMSGFPSPQTLPGAIPFLKTTEQMMIERSQKETVAAINNPKPLDIKFESRVINNVEYVTAEQHRRGMAQAAERGRQLAYEGLQNSSKVRRRLGV